LLLVPIAFTSDHIETLFELDIEVKHFAKENGVRHLHRVESLNDHPTFIRAMADVVVDHIQSNQTSSNLMSLHCPGCTNEKCGYTKAHFSQGRSHS